jgi:hypothetical protein
MRKEEGLNAKDYNCLECKICASKEPRKVFWVFTEHDLRVHVERYHGENFEKYKKEHE